jgi:hypothetical protein
MITTETSIGVAAAFLKIAPKIAEHFAHPEIKVFPSGERDRALGWLKTGT